MKRGKRYLKIKEKIDPNKMYTVDEAIDFIKENPAANFDETVDVVFRLGVDPRKSDQMVRGSVTLPHGTGKKMKILVFAKGEKADEAREAGADYVGADDLIAKIQGGWLDFDAVVATPDMMSAIGKLGRILGPRGLMPNPKTGTVTNDLKKVIADIKKGKVNFKVDKTGNLHGIIGKRSFDKEALKENFMTFYNAVLKAKPATSKGTYIKGVYLSSTMGPGLKINPKSLQ